MEKEISEEEILRIIETENDLSEDEPIGFCLDPYDIIKGKEMSEEDDLIHILPESGQE